MLFFILPIFFENSFTVRASRFVRGSSDYVKLLSPFFPLFLPDKVLITMDDHRPREGEG